jgi:hypothetical protein
MPAISTPTVLFLVVALNLPKLLSPILLSSLRPHILLAFSLFAALAFSARAVSRPFRFRREHP